ncbi:MAG TPA: hypothetical protein DD670_21115 [Planctomycetaceae bacterium]|nr:hypothetical protein [Planctomycetaceae bacterium]
MILCRNREANSSAAGESPFRAFEESLLDLLRDIAAPVAATMPHPYDLKDDGPSLGFLRGLCEPLVILSWLPSRACYWRLRAAGVSGFLAPVDEDAATPAATTPDIASGSGSRAVWCLDLHDYARPDDCAEAVRRILSRVGGDDAKAGRATEAREIVEPTSPRWYPVIDRDRCVNCLECLNFCLFGVFGLDATETILVEQPDACRPGCPACARVCPSGAILFPEHGDPTISGRAAPGASGPTAGVSFLSLLDPAARAHAEREAAQRAKKDTPKKPPLPREGVPLPGDDRLEDLVDDVDQFDL